MTRKQKKMRVRILFSLALYIALFFVPLEGLPLLALYLVPYGIVGGDVLRRAVINIRGGQVFDENFLMSVATLGAFGCGEYPEAVAVMLFYQVGELFQSMAVGESRRSIAALMDIRPDFANVSRDGDWEEVDPEEVQVGDTILVRPGERIPLDGTVLSGTSTLNTAALTGESLPRDVAEGDSVLSGCINETGVLHIAVTAPYAQSTVARILDLVENASDKKSKAEHFITKFARYYTPCVVLAALALAVIPPLVVGGDWMDWVQRSLNFLVVSCPCALVISIPLTFFSGIGASSRAGILVKGSNYLEALAAVDTVVFDKTGTLTQGKFSVLGLCPVGIAEEKLLELTAYAEHWSGHPIAKSVVTAYGKTIDTGRVSESQELAGRGVTALVDGKRVAVGNGRLMDELAIGWQAGSGTGTLLHVAVDGVYCGHLVIGDQVKATAGETIAALGQVGVKKTVMLTGDGEAMAAAVANQLGLSQYHAQLLPQNKVEAVESLLEHQGRGKLVFVGDGINDAPVLSRADIGVAMGALGSDAAIEASDIVLMDDDLTRLPQAIAIARRTLAIVRQNIVFALGVKGAILILSAFGLVGMWAAVFGDVGVAVIAICNARRV